MTEDGQTERVGPPERRTNGVLHVLHRHHWIITALLSVVALLAILSQIGSALGFGPFPTTGKRLFRVEQLADSSLGLYDTLARRIERNRTERVLQLDSLHRFIEARTLPSLITFCNSAPINERIYARERGVNCREILEGN